MKTILITGSEGFIGKNLSARINEIQHYKIIDFVRGDSDEYLKESIMSSDIIVHLAGENRPKESSSFVDVNIGLTSKICKFVSSSNKNIPIIFTSSTQANLENDYGKSKLKAEEILKKFSKESKNTVHIYRLPGVFGKWCKPNYNSVVATFCHNIANNLPIKIDDNNKKVNLVYIDDVIDSILLDIDSAKEKFIFNKKIDNEYEISIGDLANQIYAFKESRKSLITENVGTGLIRALYSTYISYLNMKDFSYEIESHEDSRGSFVEMLKTRDSGQFSYFTAFPGITRGGHYHHTKTEKFLVIKGKAKFSFRNILTNESCSIETSGKKPVIVETIPGWSHDIKNIGQDELIVMLWANEQFNRDVPDTISSEVINEKT